MITKETFDLGGKLPSVESNVRLVKGYFDQSIDEWLAAEVKGPATISLLHVDSDLYESCQILLEKLNQYIVAGTVVLFDEYFNYPNWQKHEYLAFKEFCEKYGVKYKYLVFFEQKVLVEIESK